MVVSNTKVIAVVTSQCEPINGAVRDVANAIRDLHHFLVGPDNHLHAALPQPAGTLYLDAVIQPADSTAVLTVTARLVATLDQPNRQEQLEAETAAWMQRLTTQVRAQV